MSGLERLISPNRKIAADELQRLKLSRISGDHLTELIRGSLLALDNAAQLSGTEKRWRLASLCRDHDLSAAQVSGIMAPPSQLSAGMRLAFAGFLPPALRPRVYKPDTDAGTRSSNVTGVEVEQQNSPPPAEELLAESDRAALGDALDVVLLTRTTQDATANLLREDGFSPLVIGSRLELDRLLEGAPDVCGFLIDGSFWATINDAEQRSVLNTVAQFSSFAWLWIDTTNLCMNDLDVEEIVRAATGDHQPVALRRLTLQADNRLNHSQLMRLSASRKSLLPDPKYDIAPGEIAKAELRLLQCALQSALGPKLSSGVPVQISPVRVSFFTGGRTNAKVAKILFGSAIQPAVAKIDTKDLILQEVRRFNYFIRPWDNNLDPKVYLHGSSGVIVFDLLSDRSKPESAAPMLSTRLDETWSLDLWSSFDIESGPPRWEALSIGLRSAVEKLGRLNRRANSSTGFPNYSSPYLDAVKDFEHKGRSWGLEDALVRARDRAEAKFSERETRAVVHGDIHVRNILLRDDREAFFIDYASSGPGHPCTDLVRLDLSLFFVGFRPVADDRTIASLQCDLSVHGLGKEELMNKYARLMDFRCNELYLDSAIHCRREALAVLGHFEGDTADYLASKYLFAWMSLQIASLPMALCRAVIEGIGPHLS